LATKATGRHRADVEINVLESFELRSRRSIRESERARLSRLARKQAKKLAKLQAAERAANPERVQAVSAGRYLVRAERKTKLRQRRGVRNVVTMTVASGSVSYTHLRAHETG
jgi:hypothetical protein